MNLLVSFFVTLLALPAFGTEPCSTNVTLEMIDTLASDVKSPLVINPKDASDIFINNFYQNCEAASLPPYDFFKEGEMEGYRLRKHAYNGGSASEVVDLRKAQLSQYYTNCDEDPKKSCIDICETPPTYIWGGKGMYDSDGEFDTFRNDSSIQSLAHHPGIDCSGFVTGVFALAGLKVRTDMPTKKTAFNTPARFWMNTPPQSCFKRVLHNEGFEPGDVISWRKHVVMIDQMGPDPFNLAGIDDPSQCTSEYINPLSFKIIVSNSVGGVNDTDGNGHFTADDLYGDGSVKSIDVPITGVGVGVSKVPLGQLALKYPTEIMELGKSACLAKFENYIDWKKIHVMRHKLANVNPRPAEHECLEKPKDRIKMKGLECLIENCEF